MKKRLEAELISIAHRILKLKNLSELKQLHLETQKLYETLSVLKFVEENINIIQPKIDVDVVEQKLENTFDKPNENFTFANDEIAKETIVEEKKEILAKANEKIITTNSNDEIIEESINDEIIEPIFVPSFELESEDIEEVTKDKNQQPVQISFEEFKFSEPVFEKKSNIKEDKPIILNEKLSKGINIGLNDKIAFVKYLFSESNEDYNRVLSQINTFDTYLETVTFINEIVKPDYNNWQDKDEYVLRFLESVEKKFV